MTVNKYTVSAISTNYYLQAPANIYYIPNFISEEEATLLWRQVHHRRPPAGWPVMFYIHNYSDCVV